jgi:hypothetical protein
MSHPARVAAVAAVLLLTACGPAVTAAAPAPTKTVTATETPTATASPTPTDTEGVASSDTGVTQYGVTPANGRAGLGQTITYSNGVIVHVGKPHLAKVPADAVASPGAPPTAVVVDVQVTNGSTKRIKGDDVYVSALVGADGRLADTVDGTGTWGAGFAPVIPPGGTTTATFAYSATATDARNVTVQASPDGAIAYPMVLFAGGVK